MLTNESAQPQNGPPLANGQDLSTEISDLTQAVEKSKAEIAQKSAEIGSNPRKRGRPKGSKKKTTSNLGEATPNASPGPSAVSLNPTADVKPAIEMVVKVPFEIAASNTGFEGFRLSEDESKPCVNAIDQVLTHYLPEIAEKDPKIVALWTAGLSIGGIVMAKMYIYSQWKASQRTQTVTQQKENAQQSTEPIEFSQTPIKTGNISAHDHFAKNRAAVL